MRIVINAFSARLGGGQTYIRNLLAHLPDFADLQILVYAPEDLELPPDQRIQRMSTRWPTRNPVLRTLWEKLRLPRILKRERADILFCPGGIIAGSVPKGCRTVTMFRNMMPFDPVVLAKMPFGLQKIRNVLLRRAMLRSMARADLTIFISEYARSFIAQMIRTRSEITIPHGINAAFRTAGRSLDRSSWLPADDYLLYVSRFDIYKHQMEVVQAYAALPEDLRNRHRLVLVGEAESPQASQVANWIKANKLEGQIIIQGAVPYGQLPAAYHHAAAILFASSCENCPNILLEALGAGRPVLSSSIMPMPEFGSDAVLYFQPTEPSTITEKLVELLRDPPLGEMMAARAAARSMHYSWAKTARDTWESIARLQEQANRT